MSDKTLLEKCKMTKYLDINVRTLRKCPNCKKKHYKRSLENSIVTKFNNGIIEEKYMTWHDSGSTWHCLECKLLIFQDGSWEFSI